MFLVWTETTCLLKFQWSCIPAEFGQLERKHSANILPTPASLSPVMRVLQTVCSLQHSLSFGKARSEHFGFKEGVSDMPPPHGSSAANTPIQLCCLYKSPEQHIKGCDSHHLLGRASTPYPSGNGAGKQERSIPPFALGSWSKVGVLGCC